MSEWDRSCEDIPDRIESLAHSVIGAAINVHRELGPGFLESIYESALARELRVEQVPFERQKSVDVFYRGDSMGACRLDLLVSDCLVIELKAVEDVTPLHRTQTVSYLKACRLPLGLILNFNKRRLKQGTHRILNPEAIPKTDS